MNLGGVDTVILFKQLSKQVHQVTCVECCEYYKLPDTAACRHTLCHCCWRGRKTCPLCSEPINRKLLKLNQPLQKRTEHVQALAEAFEHQFNVKMDEFLVDFDVEPDNDPTKNVKDWLVNSQNHFSAPGQSSESFSQKSKQNSNILELSPGKIQVHTETKKTVSPEKEVLFSKTAQDDWDKIETMLPEETVHKNKENIIGPMDIEPFFIDENEYTTNNPRRSSRKKELKNIDADFNTNNNITFDKENPKGYSVEIDKKSSTNTKQNWNNVKKMRKEFSKLNKINRNKLNVSIEMCKKAQNTRNKIVAVQKENTDQVIEIDENTPTFFNTKVTENDLPDVDLTKVVSSNSFSTDEPQKSNSKCNVNNDLSNEISKNMSQTTFGFTHRKMAETSLLNTNSLPEPNKARMPFYKKSALYTTSENEQETNTIKTINHNTVANPNSNDDIEITIKVGNTITNILIKKKDDIQLKVSTDRAIQTSLCPQQEETTHVRTISSQDTRNVAINIGSNNQVNIEQKQITEDVENNKSASLKSVSAKKNTASADTGTGQFEITESEEKQLSDIMECAEIEHHKKAESHNTIAVPKRTRTPLQTDSDKVSQKRKTPKSQKHTSSKPQAASHINEENLDYLNDMDIFESDNITDTNVHILKNIKNTAPSEILISTAHTKNKTQKLTEKRDRVANDEGLPTSKRQKLCDNDTREDENYVSRQSKHNPPDSEPLNYDSVMGKVFASIDADMEELQSQNIVPNAGSDNVSVSKDTVIQKVNEETQKQNPMSEKYVIDCTLNSNDFRNQKDSENIFTVCVDKDYEIETTSRSKIEKVPPIEPQPNIDDFLTPVMSKNVDGAIEIINDDSESVVEDTPQKNTSFGKLKQKSIGASKDHNSSQRIDARESVVSLHSVATADSENIRTVVNLADTSEMNTNNVTVISTAKKQTLETPLNINKFVDHIKHNSTPMARKSLNFQNEDLDDIDPEQTLCPTNAIAKTTQEREFMRKAFEKTPTQMVKPLLARSLQRANRRWCIAGSCLSAGELAKLKMLCRNHKWTYVDKYTNDLTHLVVGVDEENKSQRSVKYMRALAASKWIVSYEWVEKCLQTNQVVGEDIYEALDSTGEPGPRRSRVANKKLFQGITFFCMEPFRVLGVEDLKEMLEASGGRVVSKVEDVGVSDKSTAPAILLAEPEHTQEDRFTYLAMQQSIVPVNFEWVLNCLGSYTLGSVQELLLCPSTLMPKATATWPQDLIAREDD